MIKVLLVVCMWIVVFGQAQWNQLIEAISSKSMNRYPRDGQMEEAYQLHRLNLRQNNRTLAQYVKQTIFGYYQHSKEPIYLLSNLKEKEDSLPFFITIHSLSDVLWIKEQQVPKESTRKLDENSVFLLLDKNDFPYALAQGIEHWLIWSNSQLSLQIARQYLQKVLKPEYEYLAYINEPNHKSIPQIFHVQIFIRLKQINTQL